MFITSLRQRLAGSFVGRTLSFLNTYWLDRIGLFGAAVGLILPWLFRANGSFQFHGGVMSALALGATFTGFLVAAAVVIALVCKVAGIDDAGKRKAIPLWIVLFLATALGWLKLSATLYPSLLSISSALTYGVSALVLLGIGMLTAGRGCRGGSCSLKSK